MLKDSRLVGGIETFVSKAFLADLTQGAYEHVAYCLRDGAELRGGARIVIPSALWRRLPDALGKLVITPWAIVHARWSSGASLVHFHGFGASLWAPLAKAIGLRVVSHSHGIEWQRARWQGVYRLMLYAVAWVTCRFSDRLLVVSTKEAKAYSKLFGVDCRVVSGGFEAPGIPLECCALRKPVVVVAGRPVPEKRILDAVEAWNLVPDHRGHTLQVYCGGTYRGGYLERVQEACRRGQDVEFMPFVSHEEFVFTLTGSSYYMALSTLEGRSLAMLEALATGNVLFVADTEENREFIPPTGNHFIAAEASAGTIAEALGQVLRGPPNPAVRTSNAAAGAARSWKDVRSDCEAVYAGL
jgi:glycosyltransferase involved in cell wall biosynthesis